MDFKTLKLWENEYKNFNNTYDDCEKINKMIHDFETNGKTFSGMIIKDNSYRVNDVIDPFANRSTAINNNNKPKKKPTVLSRVKSVLTIGGIVTVGYLGYKYIYKPLKKEYDNMLDRIVVRCEQDKPMDGRIRVMTPMERIAYERKYKNEMVVLDESDYTIVSDDKS